MLGFRKMPDQTNNLLGYTNAMKAYVGTSGFQYKNWAEKFYEGVPQKDWLDFYAEHFNSVEINSSFYHLPKESTFKSWADRVHSDFRFAVKGSRYVSHHIRL